MKAWLKGGLIGGIVGGILGTISFIYLIATSNLNRNILMNILIFILYPVSFVIKLFFSGEKNLGYAMIAIPVLNIIYFFILGALIVWLISKFKK